LEIVVRNRNKLRNRYHTFYQTLSVGINSVKFKPGTEPVLNKTKKTNQI